MPDRFPYARALTRHRIAVSERISTRGSPLTICCENFGEQSPESTDQSSKYPITTAKTDPRAKMTPSGVILSRTSPKRSHARSQGALVEKKALLLFRVLSRKRCTISLNILPPYTERFSVSSISIPTSILLCFFSMNELSCTYRTVNSVIFHESRKRKEN